jgi:hypothetical protein
MRAPFYVLNWLWQAVSIALLMTGLMSIFDGHIEWRQIFRALLEVYREFLSPVWDILYNFLPWRIPEHLRPLVYDATTVWSAMAVSLNLVLVSDPDVGGNLWSTYPRIVRASMRHADGIGGRLLALPSLALSTVAFIACLLFPPLFLILNGLLGNGWAEMRTFGIYLAVLGLIFSALAAVNTWIA